jgi:MFS family permease
VTRGAGASLWRHADFMRLWSAETISQLGTQVTLLGLPLTAVLILHATPFEVGALTSVEYAPFLLIGLPAGVWVDRLQRRPILIAGDVGRAVALGSIPIAYWLDGLSMWHLYAAAFVTGICTVFFDVAYQSYLPSLVSRDQLTDGNAKLEISRSGAQLAGPALAGGLIELVTAPLAILVDAVSYVGSALFVWMIRAREPRPHREAAQRRRMRAEIAEGLRYVLGHELLRPIAACTSIANLFGTMALAILVVFAVDELRLTPGMIGLSLGLGNVGLLIGAFVAGRLAEPLGLGRTIIGSIFVVVASGVLMPLATPAVAVAIIAVASFLGGLGSVVYNVNQVSLRQAITAERMQGRMNATMRFIVWGTMPLGALAGGILGDAIGLRATLWVAAAGNFLAVIPPLLSPVRTLARIPEARAAAPPAAASDAPPPAPRAQPGS